MHPTMARAHAVVIQSDGRRGDRSRKPALSEVEWGSAVAFQFESVITAGAPGLAFETWDSSQPIQQPQCSDNTPGAPCLASETWDFKAASRRAAVHSDSISTTPANPVL